MSKITNLTGHRIGRWTVKGMAPRTDPRRVYWTCVCDCGTQRDVISGNLLQKRTLSCGCLQAEAAALRATHGQSQSKLYRVWNAMWQRCTLLTDRGYPNYGGRGITVCKRWADFANFLEDMGHAPPGLMLDRIDNNGNYEPGNCKWSTRTEQNSNTRANVRYTVNGVVRTVGQWAALIGTRGSAVTARIRSGWSVEDACTKPVRRMK